MLIVITMFGQVLRLPLITVLPPDIILWRITRSRASPRSFGNKHQRYLDLTPAVGAGT